MSAPSSSDYDAVLLISFGGPEGPDDVMPFLENVVRGKNVPRERLRAVARHYELFDGVSPINSQNRALLAALVAEMNALGPRLPVYWGNRNWHPMLEDAVAQMAEDGIRRALAFVTSPFGSYPGCRQYLEDIVRARQAVGADAPAIDKLRLFYNHPGFIEPMAERVSAALGEIPSERRDRAKLIFTAHSIPASMAAASPYERQLREACRLVAEAVASGEWLVASDKAESGGRKAEVVASGEWLVASEGTGKASGTRAEEIAKTEDQSPKTKSQNPKIPKSRNPSPVPRPSSPAPRPPPWSLAFQSRSGPPSQPWLGPDISDHIRRLHEEDALIEDIVVAPIGFMAEHVEVLYDLDMEVARLCDELGVNMVRADTVAGHPRLVRMIRELIVERLDPAAPRLFLGDDGPWPDECRDDCCRNK